MPKAAPKKQTLERELRVLNETLQRQNNFGRRFLLGISFGLGTAVGASIIFSLVVVGAYQALLLVGLEGIIRGLILQ